MNVYQLSKSFTSEFMGTMFLTLTLGWADMSTRYSNMDQLSKAMVTFASVACCTWISLTFSGGVLNPLATCSLALYKRLLDYKVISYLLAQILGSLTGVLLLRLTASVKLPNGTAGSCLGCLQVSDGFSVFSAMLAELIGGFLVVYVYYAASVDRLASKDLYPLILGAAYMVLNLAYSNSMNIGANPFRYLAAPW